MYVIYTLYRMFILLSLLHFVLCKMGFPVITAFCLLHLAKILKFSLCDVTQGTTLLTSLPWLKRVRLLCVWYMDVDTWIWYSIFKINTLVRSSLPLGFEDEELCVSSAACCSMNPCLLILIKLSNCHHSLLQRNETDSSHRRSAGQVVSRSVV